MCAVAADTFLALLLALAQYWLSVGAQASDTVKRILGTAGILPEFVHPLAVQTAVPRKDRPKKVRKKKKSKSKE